MTETFACPVCEFPLHRKPYAVWPPPAGIVITPPYHHQLGLPSYAVCRRCGYEFGQNDDPGDGEPGDSFEAARDKWAAKGRPWFDDTARSGGEL